MHQYEVGKPYHPNRRSWPERGVYEYRGGQHELLLFWSQPTTKEVEDVKRGPAEFALYTEGPLIVFLFRFGRNTPWSDSPYTIHLTLPDERTLPPPVASTETRILLHVVLVDAATGIIRALRAVTLSPEFTAALQDAIRAQSEQPFHPAAYDAAIAGIYRRFPHSDRLAAAASVKCIGGE